MVAEDRGSRVGLLVEFTLFIQRPYKCVRAMFLCLVALVLACSFFHFLEPKMVDRTGLFALGGCGNIT